MQAFPADPLNLVRTIARHRQLIQTLAVRDIATRYRGSFLGFAWSVLQPIFMLSVYTFVFSEVLKGRWPGGTGTKSEFALVLFSGLLVFNMFAEVFNRSPELILANSNYVKRVIFPLEIMPVINVISASFNLVINLVVWIVFYCVAIGLPHPTVLLLPVALLPLFILLAGLSWFLAALGVYARDITQITTIITTAFMFLTPIFFPVEAIPERYRGLLALNPLASIVKQVRDVLIWGHGIDAIQFSISITEALTILFLGYAFFQKVRRGFADVL
ncbi:ABC transporter permease [Rhodanobacter denitrificans]|uniref:Transport permease protein n=1 Tax=Rhodanobacter denitrificans TaxID=666685 RepID=M4ND33_9GAMM|nr:ABC transporter permease [Rhodanobacter denitrificans]AGG87752.1 ABC-type polysaccharide/polyol phosphate export systems, permease component [Rhodanobacter denitrificans]UJM86919.1 ABC transporter permease [Rhodanobacter denitrificans]